MMYRWPAWPSNQKSKVLLGLIAPTRRCRGLPAGTTNSVMLWAGTVLLKPFPAKLRSLRRVTEFAEVSCHRCATPEDRKLVRLTVADALAVSCLLISIVVSAPSPERTAAKQATLSGFGPVAETLVSPKPD